jgi:hypothetical protein
MIDIVSKSGKRIGRISDSMDQDDTVVIDGKELLLSDVYADEKLTKAFNDHIKELNDARKDDDSAGDAD